eukprot:CCRYP_007257-RA/>CCRYP_007257-RA protein AED:0.37 eAED:0.37 QI:0/0/0/1/0/0/4/0/264
MNFDTSPKVWATSSKAPTQSDIPINHCKDVTYGQFVCTVHPEKRNPIALTSVGGDSINYPGKVGTPTNDMLTAKIFFNSIMSTPGAMFMTMDISIQNTSIQTGRLLVHSCTASHLWTSTSRHLGKQTPQKYLNTHGYFQSKLVPGLWNHKQRPIQFSLVVDEFGIKNTGQEHMQHLLTVLKEHYNVTANLTDTHYIVIGTLQNDRYPYPYLDMWPKPSSNLTTPNQLIYNTLPSPAYLSIMEPRSNTPPQNPPHLSSSAENSSS